MFLWVGMRKTKNFLQLQNNRAKDINTEFIAVNSSFSPSKRLDYSAFLILTNSETERLQNLSIKREKDKDANY